MKKHQRNREGVCNYVILICINFNNHFLVLYKMYFLNYFAIYKIAEYHRLFTTFASVLYQIYSSRLRLISVYSMVQTGMLPLDSHLQLRMTDLFSTILTQRQTFWAFFRHMSSNLFVCHQGTAHAREQLALGRGLGRRRVIRGTHVDDLTPVLRPPT